MALPNAILTHWIHKSRTVGAEAADGSEKCNPPEPHPRCTCANILPLLAQAGKNLPWPQTPLKIILYFGRLLANLFFVD